MSELAYEGRGTRGPALLLVHGFPVDRRLWRGQLAGLAGVARVVAPDLPGFGGSPPLDAEVATMDDLAGAVVELADALGLARFVLGGLSMGGYLALALARRHAARLAGLILFDTRAEDDAEAARQGRHDDAARILAEGVGFFVEKSRPMWLSPPTLSGRPDLVAEVDAMAHAASRRGVAAALRGMAARPDARPGLASIAVPALVVCGRDDRITPPASMRGLAAAIPGASFAEVPGGHYAPLEHPDEVNAEVARFLTRCG